MPFLAPASMAILAMESLSAMDSLLTVSPVNSSGFIKRSVNADTTYDMQNKVLAGNPFFKAPEMMNFIDEGTLNHSSPVEPGAARSVLPTPAGKRSQRSVGTGVAVRADDQISRQNNAQFGQ